MVGRQTFPYHKSCPSSGSNSEHSPEPDWPGITSGLPVIWHRDCHGHHSGPPADSPESILSSTSLLLKQRDWKGKLQNKFVKYHLFSDSMPPVAWVTALDHGGNSCSKNFAKPAPFPEAAAALNESGISLTESGTGP